MKLSALISFFAYAVIANIASANTVEVSRFSPQGYTPELRAATVEFSRPVSAFGDALQIAPFIVACDDPAVSGAGRWLDDKRWTYAFSEQVPAGVSCSAKLNPAFSNSTDISPTSAASYQFSSSGPELQSQRPYYQEVSEEQAFVLRFATPVSSGQLQQLASCQLKGVGEAIPVKVISGERRSEILSSAVYDFDPKLDSQADQVLQCARRLPPGAQLKLVVASGLASAAEGRTAIALPNPIVVDFTVREPFSAQLLCERTNAQAPCNPLLPIRIRFSADVAPEKLASLRLRSDGKEWLPSAGDDDYITGQSTLEFIGPFPPEGVMQLELPEDFSDEDGRELQNAHALQAVKLATAEYPPLLKFASGSFGVIERFGHAGVHGSDSFAPPAVPVTVRAIEAELQIDDLSLSAGTVSDFSTQDDAEVMAWMNRLRRLGESTLASSQLEAILQGAELNYGDDSPKVDVRTVSLFDHLKVKSKTLSLPKAPTAEDRPFELIGIPLSEPGFHVLEAKSQKLGTALLADAEPMYVRTSVLVTNLSVHMKHGRDDFLVWVTTLDDAMPVANASVRVLDCAGDELFNGVTDDSGVLHIKEAVEQRYCRASASDAFYASARIPADHAQARGQADFSFVLSDWNRGIEPWRFNVPTGRGVIQDIVAHTVLDRDLFRAGEVVSMKHIMRAQTREGLLNPPADQLSTTLRITHEGSGQSIEQPLKWQSEGGSGASAYSTFNLPKDTALGRYSLSLTSENGWYQTSHFRVEEFKLPLLKGSIKLSNQDLSATLVNPEGVNVDLQLQYVAGGAAGQLPVSLSAVTRRYTPSFAAYRDYSFADVTDDDSTRDEAGPAAGQRLFLDKRPLVLDESGGARLWIDELPRAGSPEQWLFEASFADPNGQIQTLSQSTIVWPATKVVGVQAPSWGSAGEMTTFKTVVLSPEGEPLANEPVQLLAQQRKLMTVRKRVVGGFYRYDNQEQYVDLGELCQGTTDAAGEFSCDVALKQAGSITVIAQTTDADNNTARAAQVFWLNQGGPLWFGGENDDRIDLIPEQKVYAPGDEAEFQVRMPFAQATVLLSVEREGVLEYKVIEVDRRDPVFRLPIKAEWGPNVYVSVLAIRGRVRDVSWSSFFSWGWKQPIEWYRAWSDGSSDFVSPTTTVDLAKPAYRLGLAAIEVRTDENQLDVKVQADRTRYAVRDQARVTVSVTLPDGSPAAGGHFSFAAVDEALLELSPNPSWDVLRVMLAQHQYGVATATAQSEVVGRRHYGRKAIPAGGGGGRAPTRELLDTLLLWAPDTVLDEKGQAQLMVPLNDTLSTFKLVAIAEHGTQRFGMGTAAITASQDLQVISGLPELIREGDHYTAQFTVRNSSDRDMEISLEPQFSSQTTLLQTLAPQRATIKTGAAHRFSWPVVVPIGEDAAVERLFSWTVVATEMASATSDAPVATDRLQLSQRVLRATPVLAQQASLLRISAGQPYTLEVAPPEGALKDSNEQPLGNLSVLLRSSLAGDMPEVTRWFQAYPYTCYEQQVSKTAALGDQRQWDHLMGSIGSYLDTNGLLRYFPSPTVAGSEVLTAYVLVLADELAALDPAFEIPAEAKSTMLNGLQQVALGRVKPAAWSPPDSQAQRQLMVIEALSRNQMAQASMLDSVAFTPERWSAESLLDWLSISDRIPMVASADARREQVTGLLRSMLTERGSTLSVAQSQQQAEWWLMRSAVTAQARLLLWAQEQQAWREDIPRLTQGLISQQQKGRWGTTPENVLASLALRHQIASAGVAGLSRIELGEDETRIIDWDELDETHGVKTADVSLAWPRAATRLTIDHQGSGDIWALLRSFAAVPATQPLEAGYTIKREIRPVSQAAENTWSVGDSYTVRLTIQAQAPMSWTVVNDPVPGGASVLGSGLGRDSSIAIAGEDREAAEPTYVERAFDGYRAYFEYLPAGTHYLEYTVRLNTAGSFTLPDTRVEALYEPDAYGATPNADIAVAEP